VTKNIAQTLFYLPGADKGSTQWKVESLQLVNWGGFQNHATVAFSPTTTLLSGASGTGKSTLLDAYIAIMMDSGTPFNGASNDATIGRARGADQRSLVSYLRGKLDTGRDTTTGELADQVLRGRDTATWGALAVTFIDDNDHRFTVARLYYAPRSATRDGELTRKMCTVDGGIDLSHLEPYASNKFDKRAVEAGFPQLKIHESYEAFSQAFFTRLGIGAHGDGAKALRLLARIQAGHQVRTVDELYKSMVIELPGTYAAADAAVGHFKDLEDAYEAMRTEQSKLNVLSTIPTLIGEREAAIAQGQLVDTIGVHRAGQTPFGLWVVRTEDALLQDAEVDNRRKDADARAEKTKLEGENSGLVNRKSALDAALGNNAAHATIEQIDRDLDRLAGEHTTALARRKAFENTTACLNLDLHAQEDFTLAQQGATAFLDDYEQTHLKLTDARDELLNEAFGPLEEKRQLGEEKRSLASREGRMDPKLHATRMAIANATKIAPARLPFLGELIDVAPEHARWRKAIETTLHGHARILLVDLDDLENISRTIDPLRLPHRINFQGVDLHQNHPEPQFDARYVSGMLEYKDSVFAPWIKWRLTDEHIDALCVNSPADLSGGGLRVTIHGQTRRSQSGAHGEFNTPNVIGFSNEDRIAEIKTRLGEIEVILTAIDRRKQAADTAIDEHANKRTAHQFVLAADWPGIDANGIAHQIGELKQNRETILAGDTELRTLRKDLAAVVRDLREVGRKIYAAESTIEGLNTDLGKIADRKDTVVTEIERIENGQQVTLTEEQRQYLAAEFEKVATTGDLAGFDRGLGRLKGRLATAAKEAEAEAARAADALERIFQHYLDRWPDPNLSASVENHPTFRAILDKILEAGLHARQQEWAKRLTDWSGQDLVPLAGAFGQAIDDTHTRLEPVNAILARLPFGAHRDSLKIDIRELHRDDIVKFKRELNQLSRITTDGRTDKEILAWFERLRRFMGHIRPDSPGRTSRDYFLDVRRHIEITAVSLDHQGRERATYAALGGKSGGETQELIAFIVGAALRFQLGDEANARPSFAPVFLDEGFVKADSEFTGRSVDAWKGLGFQMIIGAPYDKFTSLEPHADRILLMTKSPTGYSAVTAILPADNSAQPANGTAVRP
jgi:uncharacterized protein YPO0396